MKLSEKRLFLFDIDGTIALDSTLFEGSRELLDYIDAVGGKSIYITNNSTKSIDAYIEKFAKWDIKTDESNFITAGFAAIHWLYEHFPTEKVFVVGTASFVAELKRNGFNVTETPDEDVKCVLVGFDNELTYEKLEHACYLLQTKQEITFAATNPDLVCPTAYGFVPDCGSICQTIVNAVKREPEYLGKPNRSIVDYCVSHSDYTYEQTVVVGDRLYTDIACGIAAGVDTCAVFTGEVKLCDLADTEYPPTYYFNDVKQLLAACKQQ